MLWQTMGTVVDGHVGGVVLRHMLHLLDNTPCPTQMWTFVVGTSHLRSQPSGRASILMGLHPLIWPTVSVMITDPPLAGEAYVT
jgi:hypothetical protein